MADAARHWVGHPNHPTVTRLSPRVDRELPPRRLNRQHPRLGESESRRRKLSRLRGRKGPRYARTLLSPGCHDGLDFEATREACQGLASSGFADDRGTLRDTAQGMIGALSNSLRRRIRRQPRRSCSPVETRLHTISPSLELASKRVKNGSGLRDDTHTHSSPLGRDGRLPSGVNPDASSGVPRSRLRPERRWGQRARMT